MSEPLAATQLQALPFPVIALDGEGRIEAANPAAESFFGVGETHLRRVDLAQVLAFDSPVIGLVEAARRNGSSIRERRLALRLPHDPEARIVDVYVGPMTGAGGGFVLVLQEQTMAERLDRHLSHRFAARSATGLSSMLAHEIKNPLSGISGAAQLLESGVSETDRALTQLIRSEVTRITALVDRVDMFSDVRPIRVEPVNIHIVLAHVRALASTGFARHIRIVEAYDPSLPPVAGNRDLLIQVFLNLVKNAAESIGADATNGEIVLTTAYRPGIRFAARAGEQGRTSLPLEIGVRDNGRGVADEVSGQLFEPFVTTKPNGSGLGLALVSKIIGDHGGTVTCESVPRRTAFLVHLPVGAALAPRSSDS